MAVGDDYGGNDDEDGMSPVSNLVPDHRTTITFSDTSCRVTLSTIRANNPGIWLQSSCPP